MAGKRLIVADLFCGAGCTSTGITQFCESIGQKLEIVAVNHWDRAVETHAANHPAAHHFCQDLTRLVEPFIVPTNFGERKGQTPRTHDVNKPMPTVTGSVSHALVEPSIVPYYGTSGPASVGDPLATVTTKDRFGLIEPNTNHHGDRIGIDIRFRMLQPHELSAAMGFPKGYKITGNREDQVKQIGNAVEVNQARALASAAIGVAS